MVDASASSQQTVRTTYPPPKAMRPTLLGSRYMVSAGHPLVANVAAGVLEAGGNAIDAGVAAGIATNVVQADMANLGGVAPILIRPADTRAVTSIAGVGVWGREASIDAFVRRYGTSMPRGSAVAVVPAAVDAWITALSLYGTWRFQDVVAPAIELADGFLVDEGLAQSLALLGERFKVWDSSTEVYWPNGHPLAPGDWLEQRDLAALLRRLAEAERGADRRSALESVRREFYEGDTARNIVEFTRDRGGWLSTADLAEFHSEVAPATVKRFGGWSISTTGPWSQGPVLLHALAMLETVDLAVLGHNSPEYLSTLAAALGAAFDDREEFYGDPRYETDHLPALLSSDIVRARLIRHRPRSDVSGVRPTSTHQSDTTYLCVMDKMGNTFSATPSDTLDNGPIVPGLGIIVSPRGLQSRLDAAHPSALGPGRRPRLTPTSAVALSVEGAEPRVWAFGSPGGDVITQAMLQALLNVVVFEMSPQEAVEAPRISVWDFPNSFHPHEVLPNRLRIERRIPARTRARLERMGYVVELLPDYDFDAGAVSMVLDLARPASARRVLAGAADPRRSCYAIGR